MDNIVTFIYECEEPNQMKIEHPLMIPYEESVEEFTHIFMSAYKLPAYYENDIVEKLSAFINENTIGYYDTNTSGIIKNVKINKLDVEDTIKLWEKVYREETFEYSERRCASDEELFALAYHKLVHSPVLETMLKQEHVFAQAVRERSKARDKQRQMLENRQTEEMNNAVDNLNITMNEKNINDLVAKHYEDLSMLQGKWSSELDTMKEVQRREYRDWVMQILEENQANSSLPTPRREPTPQILQTALALYSNDLCGLVLMTDNHIESYSKMLKDFAQICQCSTEFHFPHFEDQLEKVQESVKISLGVLDMQKNVQNFTALSRRPSTSKNLQTGDVYITRHSNLTQVHVIFHMVTDDSLLSKDINSRHAVLLGLRNILKTACSNDITSLTIPLLLQYDMTEEMTVLWCTKRAELVFKCVKGFMIEMASWGGSELKNLQFLLPRGISHAVFQSLTAMLPNIFKVSNPLVLKSSQSAR